MDNKSTPLFFGYCLHKCIFFVITAILKWRYSSLRKSDFQTGMGWEGEGIREGALIKRGNQSINQSINQSLFKHGKSSVKLKKKLKKNALTLFYVITVWESRLGRLGRLGRFGQIWADWTDCSTGGPHCD